MHDELLAGGPDEVPVIPHVHSLRVLQHNHILGCWLFCHHKSWNSEVCALLRVHRLEIFMRQNYIFHWLSLAKCVMFGRNWYPCHPRVKVLKNSISQPHPLVGDHLSKLRGIGWSQKGVRKIDKFSRMSASQRLLSPRKGSMNRMIPSNKNITSLKLWKVNRY